MTFFYSIIALKLTLLGKKKHIIKGYKKAFRYKIYENCGFKNRLHPQKSRP